MRNTSLGVVVVICILVFGALLPSAASPLSRLAVDGNRIVDEEGNTVMLRGISLVDIGAQRLWYGGFEWPIDFITGEGWYPNVVRLPVYPPKVQGYRSPYPFPFTPAGNEQYYQTLLKPLVNYATEQGLYVIIDFHQISDTDEYHHQQALDFWTFIAPRFAGHPNVIFEVFNEPIDDISRDPSTRWQHFHPRAQEWVETIREYAPENLVIVGGPIWAQSIGPAVHTPIEGTNIAYAAHPYPFNWNSWLQGQISSVAAKYPVILTEFGFGFREGDESFGPIIREFAQEHSLHWTAWVLSHDWGPPMLANRVTRSLTPFGQFVKEWLAEGNQ